jgi:predicted PurR-regulated permease PerM
MLRPLITFSGCVLVVACLYWGQAILIPIALAVLITFLLDAVVLELALHLGEQTYVRPHSI